ncbi:putative quinol monooxygenase [Roseibium salinum]|uniref:Antibiotic biosynthesis monooxygenase n=1 Tax=Roseibium salinum TaxID=1604349 RepID=A0ABT3R3B7_9HYPH|nr:antibiotic biosynthesis monooxygenase family protein [Roseibium sp. DSM 29163]MCX2723631.1 antibiotic biosynthesis monooxygenase [Roseibium sp. DSM 29163]
MKVVVQFRAKKENRQAFEAIMCSVSRDLPGADGCKAVDVLQHVDDTCRYTLVETWESQGLHQAHIEGLIADGTWASIVALLAEQPVSGYCHNL